MSKNKLTEVEKMFQGKLQDDSILNQDWNMPSDDLFLAAMDAIDEDKDKKKVFAYWYVTGIVIFALILVSIFRQYSITQLSSNDIQVAQSTDLPSTTKNSDQENRTSADKNALIAQSVVTTETKKDINTSFNTENVKTIDAASNTTKRAVSSKRLASLASVAKKNNTSINANNTLVTSKVEGEASVDSELEINNISDAQSQVITSSTESKILVETIDESYGSSILGSLIGAEELALRSELNESWINRLDISRLDMPEMSHVIPVLTPETKVFNRRTEIYGIAGASFAALHMRPIPDNGFSLTEYDNRSFGVFTGVGIRQQLSKKWSLGTDLRYSKMNNFSVFEEDHQYDADSQTIDVQGNKLYNTNLVVVSPTTRFDCDLELYVEDLIEDKEMLLHTTNINQTYEMIGVNIYPIYNALNSGRFVLDLQAGLEGNYILSFNQDMEMKMEYGDKVMLRETMKLDDPNQLNRLFLGASAGATLQYRWSDRLTSGLTISGMTGLSSIKNTADGVSTYISDVRIGFTTGYTF